MHRPRTLRLLLAAGALAVLLVGVLAAPGGAGVGPRDRDRDRRIGVGAVTVTAEEAVDGPLIAIDGRARVAGLVDGSAIVVRGDLVVTATGRIDGDVLVIRGDARVSGRVDGDVLVLDGRARLGATAVVRGDVRSTDSPVVARGARVTGEVDDIDIAGMLAAIGIGFLVFWWIAVTASTLVLGLILVAAFPRAVETSAAVGRDPKRWWQAALIGLGLVIGLPIVGIAAVSSIVGLPFGLGVLGSLGFLHALGYVTGAYFLGRVILRAPKNRFGAFFVGWGILRVVALAPVLGAGVWVIASVYGLGMLAVAAIRAAQNPPPAPVETETPAVAGVTE